jgi:ribonuclease J
MNDEIQTMRVIPLGGVEEIGINCTVVEYAGQLLVVDMGLGFPEEDMYGIDYIIPNVDYLLNRKDKIEGIVITHGHLDHIGALPYVLPKLGFPEVWGTQFTIELIKEKLQEFGILESARLRVINEHSHLASGDFRIRFFRVNHSIPQSVGVVIETPAGRIVHTGDFKFDNTPVNEPAADYAQLAKIGEQGVDLLLSDSTNSLKKGHPISESDVAKSLQQVISAASGRIFIASFSGLVGRLYQVIKIAEQLDKKVALAGYSMRKSLEIAKRIGYISPKQDVIVPLEKINRFNDDKVIILTTGSQGEENAALWKMAAEGYQNVMLKQGDTVVISAGTIPGNDASVQALIDQISSKDAQILDSEHLDFFTSGHGYQEDQKIMLNLIKPKYFMPVHGFQYFLKEHGRTAQLVGVPEKHVIIAKRGSIVEGNSVQGFKISGSVKNYPVLVSGTGVGDVGSAVLRERKQIGDHGVLVIQALISQRERKLISGPSIFTRGFVFIKTSGDLLSEIKRIAERRIARGIERYSTADTISDEIEKRVSGFVNTQIKRDPAVIAIINFVE